MDRPIPERHTSRGLRALPAALCLLRDPKPHAAHSCRGLIDVRLPQLPHIHKDISHVPNRPILRSGSFDVVVVTPVDGHRNGYRRRYDLTRHQGACGKEG